MSSSRGHEELTVSTDLIAGAPGSTDRFLAIAAPAIWSAVLLLEGDGRAGEAAFTRIINALKADEFRQLKLFDGRSKLSSFLTLFTRNCLIEETHRAFADAPDRAWRRFERLFGRDIRRRIARRFPRADHAKRDDLFQDVTVKLLEDNFRRLRAHDGRGSFEGYVLVLIDRLLIDLMRKETPRRRLPSAVEKMCALDQAVYIAVAWRGAPADAARLQTQFESQFPDTDVAILGRTLDQLRDHIEAARLTRAEGGEVSIDEASDNGRPIQLPDGMCDPEQALIAAEEAAERETVVAAIKDAALTMAPDERAYLQIVLAASEPQPPRAIARLMGMPIEEVRQIQQRVSRRLHKIAQSHRNPGVSVSTDEE